MRGHCLLPAVGILACALSASPSFSAGADFEIKGTWAADGKACSEASRFVEFDGRDILALDGGSARARVAANYSTAYAGDRLTVNLTRLDPREGDEWSFIVDGSNRLRLDSRFFASAQDGQLMKLTRCDRG